MIAEGNYGQTEGVSLCLFSFARAKKMRCLPGATGTTAMGGKTWSLQNSSRSKNGGGSQATKLISIGEKTYNNTQGLRQQRWKARPI